MKLWIVAAIVLALNLFFGYWRANVEKFSWQWFLAIHVPVPFVIAFRIFAGLGWQLVTFPVLVGAFFSGQFLGGKMHLWWKEWAHTPATSCLLWDLFRELARLPRREGAP